MGGIRARNRPVCFQKNRRAGDEQKYVFAAGPSYFENGPYYMLSRASSREEYREFLQAVGVNEFRVSSEGNAHRP